jgi:hypothetical protein
LSYERWVVQATGMFGLRVSGRWRTPGGNGFRGGPVSDGGHYDLPGDLDDNWDDFRRSLARRGRSERTIRTYRDFYVDFWRWAPAVGVEPNPAAVDHQVVNAWLDHLLTRQVTRNGRPMFDVEPTTAEQVPRLLSVESRRCTSRLFTRS